MARHKTATLEGALLDAAVAKALGLEWWEEHGHVHVLSMERCGLEDTRPESYFWPSQDWAAAGPIISRELIFFSELPMHQGGPEVMVARCGRVEQRGRGHLESGMRAFVASRFGDEVEMP